MVSENQREEITVSDGLQLGRSTVDTMDVKTVEDEVNTLQKQVTEVHKCLTGQHHVHACMCTIIYQLVGYCNANKFSLLQKNLELKELQSQSEGEGGVKPRTGSDGDSGVLVTGDENETFSTESTANGDHIRAEAGEAIASSAAVHVDATNQDDDEEPEVTSDGTNV